MWKEEREEIEEIEEVVLPDWFRGDMLPVRACSLTEGKTKPKQFHTEVTLLAAMQAVQAEIKDEQMRQSLKECSIGTPATCGTPDFIHTKGWKICYYYF